MMIINVAPAQPQNNGDNPGSIEGWNKPTKPNDIITTRANPIRSSILDNVLSISQYFKKIYGFVIIQNHGQISADNFD